MKFQTSLVLLAITLLSSSLIDGKTLYDTKDSNVINLNTRNFDAQITVNRAKPNVISVVHFYTANDGKSRGKKLEFERFADDNEGMFKAFAMDCSEFSDICSKNNITVFPTFMVYPPNPVPAMAFEKDMNAKDLAGFMSRFVNNKAKEVNSGMLDNFLKTNASIPKALLFTDKPQGIPLILKALSMNFGVIL